MSTNAIPPYKWRLALAAFFLILIAGAVLLTALALGLADPPQAGPLRWKADSLADWPFVKALDGTPRLQLYHAPVEPPAPPFTLEVRAASNLETTAWGLWLETQRGVSLFLIGHSQYVSIGPDPDWREFIHLRPGINTLYLHVLPESATFRVNGEIAWNGSVNLDPSAPWGIVLSADAQFDSPTICLYAP